MSTNRRGDGGGPPPPPVITTLATTAKNGIFNLRGRVTIKTQFEMRFVVAGTGADRDPDDAMKWVGTGGNALYTFELGDDGTLSQVSGCVALFCTPNPGLRLAGGHACATDRAPERVCLHG